MHAVRGSLVVVSMMHHRLVLLKVDRMEAKEVDGKELLQRIQQCEEKLNEFTESKLSPFNQQEILSRIEQLEEHQRTQAEALSSSAPEATDLAAVDSHTAASSQEVGALGLVAPRSSRCSC